MFVTEKLGSFILFLFPEITFLPPVARVARIAPPPPEARARAASPTADARAPRPCPVGRAPRPGALEAPSCYAARPKSV